MLHLALTLGLFGSPAPVEPTPALEEGAAASEPATKDETKPEPVVQGPAGQGPAVQGPKGKGPAIQGPQGQGPAPAVAAPLPPAPPDLPEAWVSKHVFRGQAWLAVRAAMGGPLDGGSNAPASSRVVGLGWGFELGYRAKPYLGFGMGFTRMLHDLQAVQVESDGELFLVENRGHLSAYEFLIIRFFVPTRGRIEPFFDLAGGLTVVNPALRTGEGGFGGHLRGGAGLDLWLAPRLALDVTLNYRMHVFSPGIGHLMHGAIGVKYHW